MNKKKLLSVLIKPASADCNMRCIYCFYRRPLDPYMDEESATHKMPDEVLETFIAQYLQMSDRGAGFSWQGGEPMLAGIEFFKKVTEFQIKHAKPAQEIGNAVQTNALLINDEFAKLFAEYKFLLGISIDGPAPLHNNYRGKGTQERVMKSIEILKSHNVEFNTLTVVNNITAEKPEEICDFFVSQNIFYLQFIPCVEKDYTTNEITPFSVKTEQYGRFLCRLFDKWYNKGRPYFSVRDFDNILLAYTGFQPELCQFKKECGEYVVVEYNGDVYPCDFFVLKEWKLGNLMETPLKDIPGNEISQRFNKIKTGNYKECENCRWIFICNRGCPRYRINHKGEIGENYLCQAYKEFLSYSHKRFEELARKLKSEGRTPLHT